MPIEKGIVDDGRDNGAPFWGTPLWSLWLVFWIVVFTGFNMATAVASSGPRCDLESTKHYPLVDAVETRAFKIRSPELFFQPPGEPPDFEFMLDATEMAKRRADLARGLQTYPAAERPILMLAAGSYWTGMPDGLLTFFLFMNSAFVDDLLQVLDAEGLTQHAALLREGKALFGVDYGAPKDRYARWADDEGTIKNRALDAALKELSERYRGLPPLIDIAAERIEASPELKAIYEPLRRDAPDDNKLSYLIRKLGPCLHPDDDVDGLPERLAALPQPYAQVATASIFESEMLNGAVHQFFLNSSGAIAPEVAQTFRAWGLSKHADAVQKGIDMFPSPYPRALGKRRDFMNGKGEDFDNAFNELTDIVDDGAIHEAMIRVAKETGTMPQ